MHVMHRLSARRRHLLDVSRRMLTSIASPPKPKVLVLAGATGVGKTRLSLALAKQLNGEIINADSVQQYAGMDIGSNKLPVEERQGIPHHCFDLSPISRPIAVTDYSKHAHAAIDDILSRGKVPILVGGSGFYLRWFFHPPIQPKVPPEISALVQQLLAYGRNKADHLYDLEELAERLRSLPPERFKKNLRTLALETLDNKRVKHSKSYATYYLEQILAFGKLPDTYVPPTIDTIRSLPFDYRCYYLSCDREWLNRWIDFRCEQLIQKGLLQEVKRLEMKENLSQHATVAAAIGYRQALQYLSVLTSTASTAIAGNETHSQYSDAGFEKQLIDSFPQFLATMQSATRNYVRKQDVWFRKDPFYQFLRIPTPNLPAFPLKNIASLEGTQIPFTTWSDIERQVFQQMQWTEQEYWNHPMWPTHSATTSAGGVENQGANLIPEMDGHHVDEDFSAPPSAMDLEYETTSSSSPSAAAPPVVTPSVESLPAYKSLSFPPSPALNQSLQAALRLQTNLGSRLEQKRRKEYRTQNFIFDQAAHKNAIRKAVQEVIQYNPLQEQ